jgi:MFS family permease
VVLADSAGERRRNELDAVTVVCYVAGGCLGYLINGLGPILPFLQADLGVGRTEVASYPLLYAVGLVCVGLTGERVVDRFGRRTVFWSALVGMTVGAVLLGLSVSVVTAAVGAAVMGSGGALLVLLIPAVLADRHGRLGAGAIAEANGISSAASILAPLLVAAAVATGLGWRPGFVGLPLVAAIALLVVGRSVGFGAGVRPSAAAVPAAAVPAAAAAAATPSRPRGPFMRRWLDIVLVVSAEFCFVLWATDYLATDIRLGAAEAPAVAALFLVGMAVGRAVGGQIASRLAEPRPAFRVALIVAAIGFVVFWSFGSVLPTAIGLFVAGCGIALLYPISLARALEAWNTSRDLASARAALASGVAVGGAPFILALLADRFGLHAAFLIVPVLLAGAALNDVAPSEPRRRHRQVT